MKMPTVEALASGYRHKRHIGVWGTTARVVLGFVFLVSVLHGHWTGGWHPMAWLLGLAGFPAIVLAWQWWRARLYPTALRATGPLGHTINMGIFLALYLTWWYAPALDAISDAALIFYGSSMLLAATRGYAGCEVLAVSNWILRRDDQVGCATFSPLDAVEARVTSNRDANTAERAPRVP